MGKGEQVKSNSDPSVDHHVLAEHCNVAEWVKRNNYRVFKDIHLPFDVAASDLDEI